MHHGHHLTVVLNKTFNYENISTIALSWFYHVPFTVIVCNMELRIQLEKRSL